MGTEEAGERAFDTLCEHIGGLNRKMWRHYSGLSEAQLRRGIDWLRDLFGEKSPFVKVWRGREWVYLLGSEPVDIAEHRERMLRSQITRARRDYNWSHDVNLQHPSVHNERQEELARRRLVDLRHAYQEEFGAE